MGCGNVDDLGRSCMLHTIAVSDEACLECVATYQDPDRKAVVDRAVKAPDAHLGASERDRERLANAATQATLGNVFKATEIVHELRAFSAFNLDFDKTAAIIAEQLAIYSKIRSGYDQVIREFRRLDTMFRRFWGSGLGNSYRGLEQRLKALNVLVRQAPWAMGSELSTQTFDLVTKVQPSCDKLGVCFNWGKVGIEQLISAAKVRRLKPEIAFVNALCAIAAADGEFCSAEQRTVRDLCNATPTVTKSNVKASIKPWSEMARSEGLLSSIAQSIVDIDNLQETNLSQTLWKYLREIISADQTVNEQEGEVFRAMIARLGLTSNEFVPDPSYATLFAWRDVKACFKDKLLSNDFKKHDKCPKCGLKSENLVWISFLSPVSTGEQLCGRQGPLSICPNCKIQVEFIQK